MILILLVWSLNSSVYYRFIHWLQQLAHSEVNIREKARAFKWACYTTQGYSDLGWPFMDQNSASSAGMGWILIHVWALWLNRFNLPIWIVEKFSSISTAGYSLHRWSVYSDDRELSPLLDYKDTAGWVGWVGNRFPSWGVMGRSLATSLVHERAVQSINNHDQF